MKRLLLLFFILVSGLADAAMTHWLKAHGDTSVVLRNICAPDFVDPKIWFATFDFDDPVELTIEIQALGDAVQTSFTYTGVNIDNYAGTPPAWGDPAANAVEVEVDPNVAGCINLHIRDEIMAVAGATDWSIDFIESTHDEIMAFGVQINAIADSADFQTDVTASLNAYDSPTNTEMIARTTTTAVYATATALSTLSTDVAAVQTAADSVLIDTGTDGVVVAADAIGAAEIAADAIGASELAANAIGAAEIAAAGADKIGAATWGIDATGEQAAGTFGQAIGDPAANTETMYDAVVTDAAGTNVATDIVAMKAETVLIVADTNELQTDDVPGLIAALNDITAASVWTVVVEPNGSLTAKCSLAILSAIMAGEFTQSGGSVTAKDQTGTTTRVTATVSSSGRSAITFTCP